MQDAELAEFQSRLLNVLHKETDAEKILEGFGQSVAFGAWIDQMQPEMLEVGAELVKKWGKRSSNPSTIEQ